MNNNQFSNKMIKILTLFFIIATAVILWFFYGSKNEGKTTVSPDSSMAIFKEEKSEKTISVSSVLAPSDSVSAQTKKYENTQYGFSFNYPASFTLGEFPEDESGISLIIQNAKTKQVIQIYMTPYEDSDFTVSAKQIRRDIPDLPFSNSADVIVGGKAMGVAFFSENEAFGGPTAEVWFADEKLFFQATASAKDAKALEEIIKRWSFKEI